jgi:hypothetical protein
MCEVHSNSLVPSHLLVIQVAVGRALLKITAGDHGGTIPQSNQSNELNYNEAGLPCCPGPDFN